MISVKLIDHSHDPVRSLYIAYRVCYSSLRPEQVLKQIESERISRDQMITFVEARLKTGHASPLEQVWFEFLIAGVSRSFSHQFVRHHTGISFEQQSQRYVTFKDGLFPYTTPDTVVSKGLTEPYQDLMRVIGVVYNALLDAGVPGEDARFVLPNATNTNFKITVNFAELKHIAALRLCTRAQWEFRHVVAKLRGEVMRLEPLLGKQLGPKCYESQAGCCDESAEDYLACPISRKRPHKSVLEQADLIGRTA